MSKELSVKVRTRVNPKFAVLAVYAYTRDV